MRCATMAEPQPDRIDSILPLAVERLSYRIGTLEVLRDISLVVAPASRTIVLGPNGAGKSVLMRMLHGLIVPSGGVIAWRSGDPGRVRRAQAMVFQRPVMLRRSALANVEFALRIAGAGAGRGAPDATLVAAAALAALERVGLASLASRSARLCSIGEQQRIALARAWALRPEVLFLDEPTASLDPAATRAVEEVIAAIHAAGTAIVMSTHDLGQARRLAERILFLHRGRLVEDAPAADFFLQPRSPEAAAFIAGELVW